MRIIDFGLSEYDKILNIQKEFFEKLVKNKIKDKYSKEECILIGEHKSVITLGRHANESNILISENELDRLGIKKFHIERGGDVTFHAPGQLIVYPIINLENYKLGVKTFMNLLEETVIRLLKHYGLEGKRIDGATGVWIKKGNKERKISAMGIKCSRYCTMHGLSLNVNCDLSSFDMINPCGFTDKGVTSIQKELGKIADMEIIKKDFLNIFLSLIFPFQKVFYFSEKL